MKIFAIVLFAVGCLWWPSTASSQTSLNASPEDDVYRTIDVFVAHKLVRNTIVGQRPYSRQEVARLLRESRKALEHRKEDPSYFYLASLLSHHERFYRHELEEEQRGVEINAFSELDFSVLYQSSEPRIIPDNGEGEIDAVVTSFDHDDQGKTLVNGGNALVSSKHQAFFSPYLAFDFEPRLVFPMSRQVDQSPSVTVHRLYAKTGWRNIEVETGRDNILWGQGEYGGLMLSAHARPLDMVKVTNPHPWQAPWMLKYLGPMRWTFFMANLGPEQVHSYPYFYGLKWSLQPSRYFEMGLSHTIIMGGDAAPSVTWWEPIAEIFPLHKWGGRNIGANDIANNAWGFLDFRVTIPPLRSLVLSYDGYIEDSIVRALRLPDNILNQMSFVAGTYLPRLDTTGKWGLRLEYHHMAPLSYRHGNWLSGYTLNRRVIGDPLGPGADAVTSTLLWRPVPRWQGRLGIAYEDFDSSQYYTQTNASGGGDRILVATTGIHERRYRATLGGEWWFKKNLRLHGEAGYERIQNGNFESGHDINNGLIEAGLSLAFSP
ncbi:MAG: hypothetical protein HY465_02575 [Deltaproteobacteria bacterium]|nr:hypothetical protein [Deltaproteobacteria bacterium]